MGPTPTPEPQAMAIADLQDYLIETAEAARSARASEDFVALQNSRRRLSEWAEVMTGPRLALVEVALAFLDNLMGPGLSEGALAARRFLDAWPREAALFFDDLVRGHGVEISTTRRWPAGVRPHLETLEKAGVVLREDAQSYCLTPTAHTWLREMVEPVPFRMWRVVNNARMRASNLGDNEAQAVTVAALTGVTETQARAHIARSPLPGASRSVYISNPRYVRSKPLPLGQSAPQPGTRLSLNTAVGVASAGRSPVRNDSQASAE